MARILLVNGPNLNLLGTREPEIYGAETLGDIESRAIAVARECGHELTAFQSNAEHELVERVQRAGREATAFMILNAGAITHTSIALRDAIAAVRLPFIEVHLSNVHAREDFRRRSFLADLAVGTIVGLGAQGYELAIHAVARSLARGPAGKRPVTNNQ